MPGPDLIRLLVDASLPSARTCPGSLSICRFLRRSIEGGGVSIGKAFEKVVIACIRGLAGVLVSAFVGVLAGALPLGIFTRLLVLPEVDQ